jgi:hypothetical protein
MRKIIVGIVFIGCFYLLKTSVSENSMKAIAEHRYQTSGFFNSSKLQYGDLFSICYLKYFKIKKVEHVDKPLNVDLLARDLSLYMICDSYVFAPFEGKSNFFSRVKNLHILKLKDSQWVIPPLDEKKKNVLVFEIVLRNLYFDVNLKAITSKSNFSNLSLTKNSPVANKTANHAPFKIFGFFRKLIGFLNQKISQTFYHKNIDSHLEIVMFDFDFLENLKILKAELILKLFNRVNETVVLSKDRKFLFLKNTVVNNLKGSAAYPISDNEIEEQVARINELNRFFKSKGFDHVLFSIIPNPYDLVGSNEFGQNNQLERIMVSNNLKANLLKIAPKLRVNAKNNFFQSDTHWNSNGSTIWLSEINQYLKSLPY